MALVTNTSSSPPTNATASPVSNTSDPVTGLFKLHTSQLVQVMTDRKSSGIVRDHLKQEEDRRVWQAKTAYEQSKNGNISMLQEAYESGDGNALIVLHRTCAGCAKSGRADLLMQVLELTQKRQVENGVEMDWAARAVLIDMSRHGNLSVVQAFFPFISDTSLKGCIGAILKSAGTSGSLELIDWIIARYKERFSGGVIDAIPSCTGAVDGGHFDLARILFAREGVNIGTWIEDAIAQEMIARKVTKANLDNDIPQLQAFTDFAKTMGLSLQGKDCMGIKNSMATAVEQALKAGRDDLLHALAEFSTVLDIDMSNSSLSQENRERFNKYERSSSNLRDFSV